MIERNVSNAASNGDLTPRDFILLPLTVFATIGVLCGLSEITARYIWRADGRDTCIYWDAAPQMRHKPNCVSRFKSIEGPVITYRFNECGFRTAESCGTKPLAAVRIAVLGTSIGVGLHVAYDELFTTVAAKELSRVWDRPVEFQNLSAVGDLKPKLGLIEEALRLAPDAILVVFSEYDVRTLSRQTSKEKTADEEINNNEAAGKNSKGLRARFAGSRALFMARHYMLQNDQFLYPTYATDTVYKEDVLHVPWSARSERGFAVFESLLARLSKRAHDANVRVLLMAVPNRFAAGIASDHVQLNGVDPFAFCRRVAALSERYGVLSVDVMRLLAGSPHAERLYYPMDGHPTGQAHALLAAALTERLLESGTSEAFKSAKTIGNHSQ